MFNDEAVTVTIKLFDEVTENLTTLSASVVPKPFIFSGEKVIVVISSFSTFGANDSNFMEFHGLLSKFDKVWSVCEPIISRLIESEFN